MKKIYKILFVLICFCKTAVSQCPNGGIENGNFAGWRLAEGNVRTPQNKMKSAPGNTNKHAIVSSGNDYWGGFPKVLKGSKSFRLGYDDGADLSARAGYTFVVTNSNKDFKFSYAVVLEDNDHFPKDQPRFSFWILPGTSPTPNGNAAKKMYKKFKKEIVANRTDPLFRKSPFPSKHAENPVILYREWVCQNYDLSAYVGQQVTIWFDARYCGGDGGPHFAYAYIDGLCEDNNSIPLFTIPAKVCDDGRPILMDGEASLNEESFFVAIQECDVFGNIMPNTELVELSFDHRKVGVIDLRYWYSNYYANGKLMQRKFKPNTYYKVTLTTTNQCGTNQSLSKIFQYYLPTVNAGVDKDICCSNLGQPITIGTSAFAGYTYSWASVPGGFTSSVAMPSVSPMSSTSYVVTVTDSSGCKSQDVVDVFVSGKFRIAIEYDYVANLDCSFGDCFKTENYLKPATCTSALTAKIYSIDCDMTESAEWKKKKANRLGYLWNTGETTQTILVRSNIQNYSVTAASACFNNSASYLGATVSTYFHSAFPQLRVPSGCDPENPSGWFIVTEGGPGAPAIGSSTPAYRAYRYRLRIYDEAGNGVRCIEVCSPKGFSNGTIQWDGKNNQGVRVSNGTYRSELTLWNCDSPINGQSSLYKLKDRYVCTHSGFNLKCFCIKCDTCDFQTYYETSATDYIIVE